MKKNSGEKESKKKLSSKSSSKEKKESPDDGGETSEKKEEKSDAEPGDESLDPAGESQQCPGEVAQTAQEPEFINTDILKDLLECPVCLRVPRTTPIYQCARGHVVCSECKPNVTTCPQCREPLGNIRCLVSEKVLEKLPTSCKYSDNGCKVELLRSLLPAHEQDCLHRLVNCVDLACQQKVSVAGLLAHLDSDHETEDFVRVEGAVYSSHFIVNEEDYSKDIMWISDQLHYDGTYFYRECCRSNKGLWYIWVYILEVEKGQAEKYICEISINSSNNEDHLICRSKPISIDLTKENIAESGRGLVFTDTTARLFWQDNKVRYSVNIRKKESTV